uniref:OBP47-like domain-containing protein n=1 Tax=Anopheles maculatus TaxID=74869 RepID=A0A182SJT9_9DIPT
MATTINCIRSSCAWAKVLLLLWFVQLATGEPNAACKTMPAMGKDENEQCCEMPEMFPNETLHQCMGEFERSSMSQLQKSCQFSACVLKKQNLLKSDGKLDTDQIKPYIKDKIKGSDEWKGLIEKAVLEDCLPMIEKDSSMLKQMKGSLGDCEPLPAVVIACAAAKVFDTMEQVMGHPRNDLLGCHNGTKATVDECCNIPILADKAVIEKCKSEHPFKPPKTTSGERGPHPGACIADCIMKGMSAMKDGVVDAAAFKKAVAPVIKANPTFAKLIEDAVKTCADRANMDSGFTMTKGNNDCKPEAKHFINCVYGTLFEKCPTNLWTKKEECTLLKDKIQKGCPYFALRKRHGRQMRPT